MFDFFANLQNFGYKITKLTFLTKLSYSTNRNWI